MSESRDGDTEEHNGASSELKVELGAACDRYTPGCPGQIKLERFRTPHRIILKKYDNDNDGRIDATEIQSVVDALMTEQFRSKAFKIGLIILTLFTIVLLGALFGLTWAVVAALKDTQVDGELLVTNDKARMPVMLANLEMTVGGGKLLTRDSVSPVTTSVVQSRGGVNVNTTFDKLLSMQSLVFAKTDGTSYTLSILGVARIPRENASDGAILRFQTDAGTVYLEDGVWSVSNITGPLLENLFTQIDGRGRRLQTAPPNTYVICEAGECGDPIPCGISGYSACPPSPSTASTAAPPPPSGTTNTGAGTSQTCLSLSVPVTKCRDGAISCYGWGGFPSAAQRDAYLKQPGCTSQCALYSSWLIDSTAAGDGYIQGCYTNTGTSRRFCCP